MNAIVMLAPFTSAAQRRALRRLPVSQWHAILGLENEFQTWQTINALRAVDVRTLVV